MSHNESQGYPPRWSRVKNAAPLFILLVLLTLLAQAFFSIGAAKADQLPQLFQAAPGDTDTPTPTSTQTATSTLVPLSLSFQNGVFPTASYSGSTDTFISEADPFGNYGHSQFLKINGETAPGAANANHALLKWDISQIPPGSEILAATLTFNVITPTVDVYPAYQLLKPWVFNQASWVIYAGGLQWEIPGAAGLSDRGTQVLTSFAPFQPGLYTINMNRSIIQAWVDDPFQNNGLILADSSGTTQTTFDSAEAINASNRPKLTIQFNLPPGTTPTATFTATHTSTATSTATSTSTATATLPSTSTATRTATATSSPTAPSPTATRTATATGTVFTSTPTGTIVPNMEIIKSVSPSQASVGQLFNFSIQIRNIGTAPGTSSFLVDTFPTALTITGAQTNKGTYTLDTSSNTITFTIGNINPNETVRLGVLGQVNNTAIANTNFTNSATLNYRIGTINQSRTSNSVSYRILGSSTLPPTGLGEAHTDGGNSTLLVVSILIAGVLILTGLGIFIVGKRAKSQQSPWASWLNKTGLILLISGFVFALVAWGLGLPATGTDELTLSSIEGSPTTVTIQMEQGELNYQIYLPTATPDQLPDYLVPEPTLDPGQSEEKSDTSPIEQIQIPAMGLDTVVKYVPFDGFTWQIAGLKQEIAWLGETSWPGLGKNTGLAGHVTLVDGSDGPFRYLADLRPNDTVTIYTQENIYTYSVRAQAVVKDSDMSILESTDAAQLTLITCTNWDKDLKLYLDRLIVYADLQKVEPIQAASLGN